MYFVHGHDVLFDSCFSKFKYTPLDWALVGVLERLMMQQEEDQHFVMIDGRGLTSS